MKKTQRRARRKKGIRKKIYGSEAKPRISVYKSNKHIYVQAIDDRRGITVEACSDTELKTDKTTDGAQKVGEKLAEKLLEKNIKQAVFDRNGFPYHGVVKAVAEGARKGGIQF